MGHFAQLNDDDAELLSGGKAANPRYDGSNYGQYKKFSTDDPLLPPPGQKKK